jgi:hypothetical protein
MIGMKKIWIYVLGLIMVLVVSLAGLLIFYDFGSTSENQITRGLDTSFLGKIQSKFADNQLSGLNKEPRRVGLPGEQFYEEDEFDVYPIKLQLIGTVDSFDKGILKLREKDYIYEIKVGEEVGIKCMPETTTDKTGREIQMSETFIDFSRSSVKNFDKITIDKSKDIFQVGETVTVIAQKEKDEVIYAQAIIGYGCENDRLLKVEL